ncbi:hypothetical protein PHYSODRAFT_285719 [Phytophthora sojae]|uniref:RxLR effector protein n=2 Tax=Phytophthora sojae TaxID=67593 RepID=G4Z5N5_PHYSP|nr:hypothetical protein PHYSODRAFT_285719 [Phytophthora sojae]AEK81261.1 Avh366 [Phytophthora sojae]AEK81262.1 Avh366 [Phytophthora sojae]AEK81263.1 Avh366 [Phytophthora sojae]EGZ22349.1 hypothetical protein PHYSODRAFT_285719 [Phytophthora sojae]|eukprot:XP_009525066.1 hypothetical protein PHYSODRAFT_285719 [Phytophthora sojae]
MLLLAVLAFHASSDTLVAAELRRDASLGSSHIHRRLRGIDAHFPDSEDRGDVVTSLVKSIQVQKWFLTGKTDDFVKKALNLNGLSNKAMEASPNYKYYVKFFLKTEPQRFKDWLNEGKGGLPTHWAWARLGLRNMDPATRDQSAAYKAYMRYAKHFDDDMYQRVLKNRRQAFRVVIGPFPDETSALIRLWVATKRPDWYVEKMLGTLPMAPPGHLGEHYFKEYMHQLMLREQAARKRGK